MAPKKEVNQKGIDAHFRRVMFQDNFSVQAKKKQKRCITINEYFLK